MSEHVTHPTTNSLLNELQQRVEQLQELNRVLAAEVDRMQIVLKMAQAWAENDKGFTRIALRNAVETYNQTMKRLAKETT